MRVHPTVAHREFDLHRMRTGLASAAAIVMNSYEAADRVHRRMPGLCDRPVLAIPTGFDPVDFEPGDVAAAPDLDDAAFKIVHTGSMHTQLGLAHRRTRTLRRVLGGTSVDVDILTRSHVYLVQAIEQVLDRRPDLRGRLQLHLAGTFTGADLAVIEGRAFVTTHGHLSHDSTLALMRAADLLFLPLYDLPAGQRAGLIPYKTYEYLAARRPVLGAVPEGDARDFLAGFDRASVCRPTDVAGMAAAIEERVALAAAAPPRESDNDVAALKRLERSGFMTQLAGVLDGVLADRVRALAT
jgi:glycosyltransferase involved in cell wall biosynthesis